MASASAEAAKLKGVMARHGVQCSIELQIGRPWSGDDWYSAKSVLMNHHTAGSTTGLTPSLGLVKRGRGDALPGPLCNGYGGRDHVYRIITMGLANHPGAGGPITVAGFRIPKDSARISSWGTEWEHDGVSAWPADMQEFMGRSNAALCEFWGIPAARSIEHKTWAPARKIDRNRYSAEIGQAEIRKWAASVVKPVTPAKQEELDVDETRLRAIIREELVRKETINELATKLFAADVIDAPPADLAAHPENPKWRLDSFLRRLVANTAKPADPPTSGQ